jgi:hypothetical protein
MGFTRDSRLVYVDGAVPGQSNVKLIIGQRGRPVAGDRGHHGSGGQCRQAIIQLAI